jgi:hypothetical protein
MTLPPIGFVASSQHGIAKADQCSLATADPSAACPHAAQDARCCRTEHQLVPCRADRHIKHTVQYVVHTRSIRPRPQLNLGFVPLLRELPGFREYYLLEGGPHVLVSIRVFDSADEALASNEIAANWMRHNVLEFVRGMPEVMAGNVLVASSGDGR